MLLSIMRLVYFYDSTSDKNHISVLQNPIGGSEYQMYNLIGELSKYLSIICFNNTYESYSLDNVVYEPLCKIINHNFNDNDTIIFQRFFPSDENIINKIKHLKIYIWCHDINTIQICSNNDPKIMNKFMFEDDFKNLVLFRRYVTNKIINNNANFIFVSNYQKISFVRDLNYYGINVNESKLFIIYNILYEKEFALNKIIPCDVNYHDIVFASSWTKNIEKIIEIFEFIMTKTNKFRLVLLSPGYDNNTIQKFAPLLQEKFRENVIIHASKNKNDYCEIIKSSLCVLSSRFPETFGCVFAESYYLGTPVIADSESGAVREIIDNNY